MDQIHFRAGDSLVGAYGHDTAALEGKSGVAEGEGEAHADEKGGNGGGVWLYSRFFREILEQFEKDDKNSDTL